MQYELHNYAMLHIATCDATYTYVRMDISVAS